MSRASKLWRKLQEAKERRAMRKATHFAEEREAYTEAYRTELSVQSRRKAKADVEKKFQKGGGVAGSLQSFSKSFEGFYKEGKKMGMPSMASGWNTGSGLMSYGGSTKKRKKKKRKKKRRKKSSYYGMMGGY